MAQVTITSIPFKTTIDPQAIASGLIALMDQAYADSGDSNDCSDLIRFGLLPARWMNMMEEKLRDKFLSYALLNDGDECISAIRGEDEFRSWNLKEATQEAMHLVTLALYEQVEMVV